MSKRLAGGRANGHEPMTNRVRCHLCSSESPFNTYSRPSNWTEENRRWANSLCHSSIPLRALVCRACVRFIRHHMGEKGVSPRWAPKERHQMCCIIEGCGEVSHTSTTIATHNIAREYLDIVETADSDSSALALCNPHYQHLYRALRFPLPCAACASQPRYGGDFIRRCPNPTEITRYLQQMIDFDGILSSDRKVCKQCYDFHRWVLHLHNSPQSTPVLALDDIVA